MEKEPCVARQYRLASPFLARHPALERNLQFWAPGTSDTRQSHALVPTCVRARVLPTLIVSQVSSVFHLVGRANAESFAESSKANVCKHDVRNGLHVYRNLKLGETMSGISKKKKAPRDGAAALLAGKTVKPTQVHVSCFVVL